MPTFSFNEAGPEFATINVVIVVAVVVVIVVVVVWHLWALLVMSG